jgi:hypothetical protein
MTGLIILVVGYLASILLAISLLVNNDLKFRWLNSFGCLAFIIYGLLIQAFPIILTNVILLVINLYYLIKIYRRTEDFDLIEINGSEPLVHKFLEFYKEDIHNYFPNYVHEVAEGNICFMVLRDLVFANIFIATPAQDGTAVIKINYTVPRYRDFKVGKFIFMREKKYLLSKGLRHLWYEQVSNKHHEFFLQTMGFKKIVGAQHAHYVKDL